ncbi:MAG: DUF7173 family protein [Burkholderiales bacterium]
MTDLEALVSEWVAAKQAEQAAVAMRRAIEDRIRSLANINDAFEGTTTVPVEGYSVKVIGRITRKVDSDKLQQIAAELDLTDHLSTLFRWKAEIVSARWRDADETITRALSAAITSEPGRPTFAITKE